MTSIKIHQAENGTFVVEGLARRREPIPAFAMPGHMDAAMTTEDERSIEVILPALRFAATVDKMLELVRYREGEGDLEEVIYGPGRQPARNFDGSDTIPPCNRSVRLSKLEHGYMVVASTIVNHRVPPMALDGMESAQGRDMAKFWPMLAWAATAASGAKVCSVETRAVATLDEALEALRRFFASA